MITPFYSNVFRHFFITLGFCLPVLLRPMVQIASAETPTASALSWVSCLAETLQNQPNIRSKHAAFRQAEANRDIARSRFFPQISASAGLTHSSKQDTQNNTTSNADNYSVGLTGQQLIWDGLSTMYDWQQADYRAQSALAEYQKTKTDAWLTVRQAFIELLRAQTASSLSAEILARRQQNLDLVALRYRAGREHHGSLALAQAQLAQAHADQGKSQRAILLAQANLCQALGRFELQPIAVTGSFEVALPDKTLPNWTPLIQQNPQYLQAQCQWEAARAQNHSGWSDFSPALYANASLNRTGDEWFPTQESWSAGLSLSWTLFNGGKRWSTLTLNQAVEDQAQAQLDSLALQLRSTLLSAYITWQNAAENVTVSKQFLAATEERAKISEAQYSTGLITFDNWILIENDLVSAKNNLLNAEAQALNAHADWVHARGGAEHE